MCEIASAMEQVPHLEDFHEHSHCLGILHLAQHVGGLVLKQCGAGAEHLTKDGYCLLSALVAQCKKRRVALRDNPGKEAL